MRRPTLLTIAAILAALSPLSQATAQSVRDPYEYDPSVRTTGPLTRACNERGECIGYRVGHFGAFLVVDLRSYGARITGVSFRGRDVDDYEGSRPRRLIVDRTGLGNVSYAGTVGEYLFQDGDADGPAAFTLGPAPESQPGYYIPDIRSYGDNPFDFDYSRLEVDIRPSYDGRDNGGVIGCEAPEHAWDVYTVTCPDRGYPGFLRVTALYEPVLYRRTGAYSYERRTLEHTRKSHNHVQATVWTGGGEIAIATAVTTPEPSTWALLGTGLAVAGAASRRRRTRTA